MITIIYTDVYGHGMVSASMLSPSVYGYATEEITNPIFLVGDTGTYHFGINRVLFQMD